MNPIFFQKFRKANNNKKSIHDLMDFGGFGDIAGNLVNEDGSVCISSHLDEFGEESDFIKELMAWMKLETFTECNNANDLQNFKDISLTNQSIHQLIVKNFCKNIKIKEPIKAREIQLEMNYSDGTSVIDLKKSKQTIDQLLDQNQIAGINYYPSFMVKDDDDKHARHGSSIVGREFRDGQCWYMVRNSWGPSCDGYVTKIAPKDPKPDIDCKNGGEIWIREDQLLPNVYGITYIE